MILDQILKKAGVEKYEELSAEEKVTANAMMDAVAKSQISVKNIKEYIHSMRVSVDKEISVTRAFDRIGIFKVENPEMTKLQARLRNYILFEEMLTTPERVKKEIEESLETK